MLRYVTLRYITVYAQPLGGSWDSAEILRGFRRPRDDRGPDTRNVYIWFDTTRRGDGRARTRPYVHGNVAACFTLLCVWRGGDRVGIE